MTFFSLSCRATPLHGSPGYSEEVSEVGGKEGRGRGPGRVGGIWSGGPSEFHKDRVGVNHSPGEGD